MAAETPSELILVVDDDAPFRQRLARALTSRGFEVQTAPDAVAGLELARTEAPDRVIVDLRMPGRTGLWLVAALNAIDPTIRVLVLTGYGSIATAVEAMRLGACHYLAKPADADEILGAFERAAMAPDAEIDVAPPTAADSPARSARAPSLARAEWEHIQRVLGDCQGNISEAARRLGLHRRSLQRKLQKYPPNV